MNTGGPAFPHTYFDQQLQTNRTLPGMTIRDYFAAKAMQAHMRMAIDGLSKLPGVDTKEVNETIAAWSYQMADAMLSQRGKK